MEPQWWHNRVNEAQEKIAKDKRIQQFWKIKYI